MPQFRAGRTIVSSNQINPGIIVDSDINASAAIQATKIQSLDVGTNGGVIPSTGIVNAHVAAAAAIAYSKLAALTRGGVLIGGASNVATVLGAGTSGQALKSNGAGADPSWGDITGDWQQLGETILGSNASSISVSSFAARKDLHIRIDVAEWSGAGTPQLTFNSDTGANYAWTSTRNSGSALSVADTSGASNVDCYGGAGTTSNPLVISVDVFNSASGTPKAGSLTTTEYSGATIGDVHHIGFVWNNTGAQITTVTLTASANNFTTGSRITVYGKKD